MSTTQWLAQPGAYPLALLPAWTKVQAAVAKEKGVTEAELGMLARMSVVFERHVGHALSMTAPPGAV